MNSAIATGLGRLLVIQSPMNYADAELHCQSLGARLTTIHSAEENAVLHSIVQENSVEEDAGPCTGGFNQCVDLWWLGGEVRNHTWTWTDGLAFSTSGGSPVDGAYVNWADQEPDGHMTRQYCLKMNADGSWYDRECTGPSRFVCALWARPPVPPLPPPSPPSPPLHVEETSLSARHALTSLYQHLHGESWYASTNWLHGDPCVERWHGVGCEAGDVTGLYLGVNNLTGSFPDDVLDGLPQLRILAVHMNAITGTIPASFRQLSALNLYRNHLDLPRDFRQRQHLKFATATAQAKIGLAGLPPISCTAFGPTFVTGIFDVNQCVDCSGGYVAPLVLLCTVVGVAAALLAWYFVKVMRIPDVELKRWPSTVTMLLYHLQMVALITSMQLDWPPIFRDITRLLSLSWILRLPSISCVLNHGTRDVEGIVRTLSLAVSMLGVLNIGLFSTLGWRTHVARRARLHTDGNHRQRDEALVDRCEFILSIVFALQLPIMWNVAELLASNTFQAMDFMLMSLKLGGGGFEGVVALGITAMVLSCVLLMMQPMLGLMFRRRVRAFALGVRSGTWRSTQVASFYQSPARMLSRGRRNQTHAQDANVHDNDDDQGKQWIAPQRLNQRVRFLVNRYAVHAPEWQLVIWLRQSFMAILSILYNNVAHPMGFGWTGLNDMHYESFWLGGCLATMLAFFTFSWWHHWQQRGGEDGAHRGPYAFDYQNRIESRFLVSMILMLLLQVVWVTCVEAWRGFVQSLMIGVLLLSVANALFELLVRRSTVDDSKVLSGAIAKIDRPLRQALLDGDIRLVRCDWLCNESKSGTVIKRMQELSGDAFFSASEAAELLDRGDRSVLALSYRWHSRDHPDEKGETLASLRRYLASQERTKDLGLFWE